MADALTKPTFDGASADFDDLIDGMDGGDAYIAAGAGFESEATMAAALDDQTAVDTLLGTSFEKFGTFQEEPYSMESKVELKKTYNYVKQGKRSNTISLNFAGLSAELKKWCEEQLNATAHTIIIRSTNKAKLLVFNGLKWAMEWSSKADDWYLVTIKTEFTGNTANKVVMLTCPEAV